MSLLDRLKKVSTVAETAVFSESTLLHSRDMIPTEIPLLNIALAGAVDGGLSSGVNVIAGPSKHFKSLMALLIAKAYMDKFEDAVMIFVDSEFGTPQSYVKNVGIDPGRILHIPVSTIEQARTELTVQLQEIKRTDKVIFVFDSVGNLASNKETQDAASGKEAADMTRAKVLKSLFRIVTPQLVIKDCPMIVINHTYQTMEMYSKTVMSGGTGIYYSATNIWFMGREQDKDEKTKEILGYDFSINIDKSRYVREKSKLKLVVRYDGGVDKYSGIFDLALDSGHIRNVSAQKYVLCDPTTGEVSATDYKRKDLEVPKIMKSICDREDFKAFVKKKFQLEAPKTFDEMMAEADGETAPEILMEEREIVEQAVAEAGKRKGKK
jgi:RecA/RadA recombinase